MITRLIRKWKMALEIIMADQNEIDALLSDVEAKLQKLIAQKTAAKARIADLSDQLAKAIATNSEVDTKDVITELQKIDGELTDNLDPEPAQQPAAGAPVTTGTAAPAGDATTAPAQTPAPDAPVQTPEQPAEGSAAAEPTQEPAPADTTKPAGG